MKTVITATGNSVDAPFDLRFGRAGWFCLLDENTGKYEFYENEFRDLQHGAGMKVVEQISELGAQIRSLKKALPGNYGILLLDAPPVTSCPVVETVSDADYVVLVTEPTPFGLHDMKLMVDLLRKMGLAFGVVINKASGKS